MAMFLRSYVYISNIVLSFNLSLLRENTKNLSNTQKIY